MWDIFQNQRLKFEEQILSENHPHLEITSRGKPFVVKVWYKPQDQWYRIRIEATGAYPDDCPKVFVEVPNPLLSFYAGKKFSDFTPSHNYHALAASSAGEVQICHFSSRTWDASKSLHLVALKAKLWLSAYEEHRKSGVPICNFFGDCSQ